MAKAFFDILKGRYLPEDATSEKLHASPFKSELLTFKQSFLLFQNIQNRNFPTFLIHAHISFHHGNLCVIIRALELSDFEAVAFSA